MRKAGFGPFALLVWMLAGGCGDNASDAGGSGGSGASDGGGGAGTVNDGGAGAGTVNDGGAGAGTANDGGAGGGTTEGGASACTETIEIEGVGADLEVILPGYYIGSIDPAIGDAGADTLEVIVREGSTGVVTLHPGAPNYGDCGWSYDCIVLTQDGGLRFFLSTAGTVDFGDTTGWFPDATITDVDFVEVILDDSFDFVPVAAPACAHITSIHFAFEPPVEGWVCEFELYNDGSSCDCACGAPDPDCEDPTAFVYNCPNRTDTCVEGECVPPG